MRSSITLFQLFFWFLLYAHCTYYKREERSSKIFDKTKANPAKFNCVQKCEKKSLEECNCENEVLRRLKKPKWCGCKNNAKCVEKDGENFCECWPNFHGQFCQFQGKLQRIRGTASISPHDNETYFRGAHLALDGGLCCYEDTTCAYSSIHRFDIPVANDVTRWWSLDMQALYYIDHIEIYGWVGNFSSESHISIGAKEGVVTNPQCSPAKTFPDQYVPSACKGDHLAGRYLALFKHVHKGEDEFKFYAVVVCEVYVYGVKIN